MSEAEKESQKEVEEMYASGEDASGALSKLEGEEDSQSEARNS